MDKQTDIILEPNLKDLLPRAPLNRRLFVTAGALATGFSLAVQPVSAQTITTDTQGLSAGEIKVSTPKGDIPGYAAMPAAGGPFPTILVLSEIWGVHAWVQDICRRLAKQGYLAVAVDHFVRYGDVTKMSNIQDILKVVSAVPDADVMSNLDSSVAWAKASGKANLNKLAVTGFCWGGRQTWLYALHNPTLKAAVPWYGQLRLAATNERQTRNVIDFIADVKAPVLGLYGAADTGIPVPVVMQALNLMQTTGRKGDIVIYPDTPHAFLADYRPSYRKEAAEDAWRRMLVFLKANGVA
jgi:carboxymethylenebutenolidase